MITDFDTRVWYGEIQYGSFSAKNWFSIGGIEHPLFKTLINRIKQEVPEIYNFELYTMGGILEDWMSWDVDLALVGDYKPDLIKRCFEGVVGIAFDLHLYVDIQYQKELWRIDVFSESGDLNEIHDNYELSNFFSRNGEIEDLSHYEYVDGIYKRKVIYPFPKHIEKRNEGHSYKSPIRLI
jgi:hypothetical protein